MKTFSMSAFALLSVLIAVLLFSGIVVFAASEGEEVKIPGQYIVVLNDSVTDVDRAEEELTRQARGERLLSYRHALRGFSARLSPEAAAELANDPRVAFVSEDRAVSIMVDREPRAEREPRTETEREQGVEEERSSASRHRDFSDTAVSGAAQVIPTGVDRINAENKANKGAGVHVAVIDTGIALDHPDLKNNIAGGKNCSSGTSYNDRNGHGTHVAGTIAALDNSIGVVGVAPEAKLWAVRVLNNSGSGTWSSVICGLDFVASKGPANGGPITVANMRLGGGGTSDNNCGFSNNDALHKAVCRVRDAGVTLVVAAGNSNADATKSVPAAYNDAVTTVSSLADSNGTSGGGGPSTSYGADNTFASFSNGGAPVDIGAPGVNIYSTWLKKGYKSISGTSMASPHAAGAAALYLATNPGALWSEVRDALIGSGEILGSGHTDQSGKHPENVLLTDFL